VLLLAAQGFEAWWEHQAVFGNTLVGAPTWGPVRRLRLSEGSAPLPFPATRNCYVDSGFTSPSWISALSTNLPDKESRGLSYVLETDSAGSSCSVMRLG